MPHARGHYTLIGMKMLFWVPHLRARILGLGRRFELYSGIIDTTWVSLAISFCQEHLFSLKSCL